MTEQADETIREAVAVFDDAETLEAAVDALQSAGFDRAEISLLAGEHAVAEKLGHVYTKVSALEDDPAVPRTAWVGKEEMAEAETGIVGALMYVGAVATAGAIVASGGTLAGAIVAAALAGGAGGLVGSVLADILERRHADAIRTQLEHGGLLLWVRLRDGAHEARAMEILCRLSAHDVHVHDLPASGQAAWSGGAGAPG